MAFDSKVLSIQSELQTPNLEHSLGILSSQQHLRIASHWLVTRLAKRLVNVNARQGFIMKHRHWNTVRVSLSEQISNQKFIESTYLKPETY